MNEHLSSDVFPSHNARPGNTVVTFGDAKQPALYFDRVIPSTILFHRSWFAEQDYTDLFLNTLVEDIFWRPEARRNLFIVQLSTVECFDMLAILMTVTAGIPDDCNEDLKTKLARIRRLYADDAILDDSTRECVPSHWKRPIRTFRELLWSLFAEFGITGPLPIYLTGRELDIGEGPDDPLIRVCNIPLIDADKASWSQIAELRKSPTASATLHRVRDIIRDTMAMHVETEAQDALLAAVDEYKAVAKKFGFTSRTSSLSVVFPEGQLPTASTTAGCTSLLDERLCALGAADHGILMTADEIRVEYARKRYGFNRLIDRHQTAYLIENDEALSSF